MHPDNDIKQGREQLAVLKWRRKCLLEVGFTYVDARLIAESDVDLHDVLKLRESGATPDEVRRIVL